MDMQGLLAHTHKHKLRKQIQSPLIHILKKKNKNSAGFPQKVAYFCYVKTTILKDIYIFKHLIYLKREHGKTGIKLPEYIHGTKRLWKH